MLKRSFRLFKAFALLNMWFRKRDGKFVFANDDINAGFELWDSIAQGQDYGLPPYIPYPKRHYSFVVETRSRSNFGSEEMMSGVSRKSHS
jgi:hypothetical protein